MNAHLNAVIAKASSLLNARAGYARDVIAGYQNWSGSDLQGKASKYGARYAGQRVNAAKALAAAGGAVIAINRGKRVTAVAAGQTDFGDALYVTTEGTAVAGSRTYLLV